jgi:hypothetical protein
MGRRKWLWLTIATLVVTAAAALVVFVQDRRERYRSRVAPTQTTPIPYDRVGWATGSATLRHGMALQMIDRNELIGLSRVEIVDKLGTPSRGGDGDLSLAWYIGQREEPTGWFWNYEEYLSVRFDDRDVCERAVIFGVD